MVNHYFVIVFLRYLNLLQPCLTSRGLVAPHGAPPLVAILASHSQYTVVPVAKMEHS